MELRDIEIFLTLAEELHFGRTATRLRVTPARVSQSIAKQERRIGAALFDRSSRSVVLTAIGERLRDDLSEGYQRIQQGLATATSAAKGLTGALRLGVLGPVIHELAPITRTFGARHPECELSFREIPLTDPFRLLRDGGVDIAVLWLPVEEPDLTVGPVVFRENSVLAVAVNHPLARRDSVSLEDLADQVVVQAASPVPDYWVDALSPRHTPSGKPIKRGPKVSTNEESLAAIASGQAVAPAHETDARYYARPDIVYVPIHDAKPQRWALIWRTTGETELIRAYVRVAREITGGLTIVSRNAVGARRVTGEHGQSTNLSERPCPATI
ncbi:LysR family transcriptional regulator [Stackebrandtia nassauensis]|uniref:Transcriptional regulator, LysR family n=1 Tax=Stackebrandtia nassauensis (strain DSM 44728 / CIP 108903 / NRRL B-16338 / NBRC 102104 / LLR-40K-21) TaxID=446470 RepID=D3Q195_STANL|nr:LysR family transcriptional regulator [Stackebrandtia nassauensis]ADD45675.1 transcriptional regulator, LysR family [Stackebrandtia nassauensis DSM 44728]